MPSKGGGSSSSSALALKTLFYNDDYGLDNATATAVAAHLASQGCTRSTHLRDVDDDDVTEMVATLGLLKYPAKRLARMIAGAREAGPSSNSEGVEGAGGEEHGHLNEPGPAVKRQREHSSEAAVVLRSQRDSAAEEVPVRYLFK